MHGQRARIHAGTYIWVSLSMCVYVYVYIYILWPFKTHVCFLSWLWGCCEVWKWSCRSCQFVTLNYASPKSWRGNPRTISGSWFKEFGCKLDTGHVWGDKGIVFRNLQECLMNYKPPGIHKDLYECYIVIYIYIYYYFFFFQMALLEFQNTQTNVP